MTQRLPEHQDIPSFVVGSSSARALLRSIQRIAQTDWTVLIQGETGTGKTVLAHHLHSLSQRSSHPLVVFDSASLPETLMESELFGHEKGSFTGAHRSRGGVFEEADGGTLLLDEIGNLPLSAQATLLTVLQEQRVRRIGGGEVDVDVRVIAATNRPLAELVEAGLFRQDLYYRLNACELTVPPLRNRRDDIPELVTVYLRDAFGQLSRQPPPVPEKLLAAAQECPWPGNIRELQNFCKRVALLTEDVIPTEEALLLLQGEDAFPVGPPEYDGLSPGPGDSLGDGLASFAQRVASELEGIFGNDSWPDVSLSQVTELLSSQAEREMIRAALTRTGGNKSQAARLLGINHKTLHYKIRNLEISAS